ncbi:MAG TPA: PLP-dependent aminotransferase family protein [Solirubrobacteraceae bacterium]|nr:PLP-dependent aminotransferase family protein [Solirubrobacteraceae bacterium]
MAAEKGTNSAIPDPGSDSGYAPGSGPASGPELLIELDRAARGSLRAQLENGLREAVRSGRLAAGGRLPATRALAADLGVSRRLVVDAYAQLLAEGYLVARHGAGTFVAEAAGALAPSPRESVPRAVRFDFFPGYPDLASFPRGPWLRALRETLREMPHDRLGYPDSHGAVELRNALAEHLRRVRGVAADPGAIVVCSGAAQALVLLARVLAGVSAGPDVATPQLQPRLRIAVEDPGLPPQRRILAAYGAHVTALPVDEDGARVGELKALTAGGERLDAVLVTPAHQSPTGVALAPERRAELLEWAGANGAVVIEDDYDAEYRYDRAPLAALQGLAPDRVIYLGTVSKTLAPALRLGWMVLPPRLVGAVAEEKVVADSGSPTLDQLALARLIESGAYDRHLRQARRRYRARRDALVAAVAAHLPGARVTGVAAGLHAVVRLDREVEGAALVEAARGHSVAVYPLGYCYAEVRPRDEGLVLGYANLSEPAIEEGIRRLALALADLRGPTKEGGATLR